MTAQPRLFTVHRQADGSGVSGIGRVLDGVVFPNGKTVVCWRTETVHGYTSVGVYDSFEAFKLIHVDSHPTNRTVIEWLPMAEVQSCRGMIDTDEALRVAYSKGDSDIRRDLDGLYAVTNAAKRSCCLCTGNIPLSG